MTQHTPGPWTYKRLGLPEDDPWYTIIDSRGRGGFIDIKYTVLPEEECLANARLIAKAPEMLAMLKALSAAIAPTREGKRDGGTFGMLSATDDGARALLKEIEG